MILLATTPSPLWYADRGTGAVAMVLLTATVVLGMGTTVRWKSPVWPKYISVPLHQNADNHFLVTATNTTTNQPSAASDVPTITEDSITLER